MITPAELRFATKRWWRFRHLRHTARKLGWPVLDRFLGCLSRSKNPVLEYYDRDESWAPVPLVFFRFPNRDGSCAPAIRLAPDPKATAHLPPVLRELYSIIGGLSDTDEPEFQHWGIIPPEAIVTASEMDLDIAEPGNDYWDDDLPDLGWVDPHSLDLSQLYAYHNIGTGDYDFATCKGKCLRYELPQHFFYENDLCVLEEPTVHDNISFMLAELTEQWLNGN